MIKEEQLIEIGYVQKTHGLKGEFNVAVTDAVFDEVEDCDYLVCAMDGIFVPFFIDQYRWKNDSTCLMKFEDIDSAEQAEIFCGEKLYFDRRCFSEEEEADYDETAEEEAGLRGYHVVDTELGDLGEIIDIDQQTANILFIVAHGDEELLIPAAEDLIIDIDDDKLVVTMQLPTGLVNLAEAESEDEPFLQI